MVLQAVVARLAARTASTMILRILESLQDWQSYAVGRTPVDRQGSVTSDQASANAVGVGKTSLVVKPPAELGSRVASPCSCRANAVIRVRPTPLPIPSASTAPSPVPLSLISRTARAPSTV